MSTQTITDSPASEIVSYDPATRKEIGRVPLKTPAEVREAIERARAAQPAWAAHSFRQRAKIILKARELILQQIDDIGSLIFRKTGKPVPKAMSLDVG